MCNSAAYNRSSISLVGVSFTCFSDHRLAGQQAAADRADRGLDPGFGEPFGEADRGVLPHPIRIVDNVFQSSMPFCWRVQIACSMASSTIEVAIVDATPGRVPGVWPSAGGLRRDRRAGTGW